MLETLENAEHYIFLEYFIIAPGEMWDGILNVLEKKARAGLDVRLIYDDFGCVSTMPENFSAVLRSKGIRCEAFNPILPLAVALNNNRDHRKIAVIDGYIAFTGGINLADEYINRKKRFGYWKDTGIKLTGEAVRSFTVMFLELWSVLATEKIDYNKFDVHAWHPQTFEAKGFVQPYTDSPFDKLPTGESVYMNIINRAKHYVYIYTPYLICDNEVLTALCMAADSGVDVRIITPGIPDKKTVFFVTQSYYDRLVAHGVKIFEYQPGFVHAKCFVCDDEIAAVGTINLDFRGLYLHFECGVWMYGTDSVADVKGDFLDTQLKCREITLKECLEKSAWTRLWQSVLRLFAPLL